MNVDTWMLPNPFYSTLLIWQFLLQFSSQMETKDAEELMTW